jgi:hypothetical protein
MPINQRIDREIDAVTGTTTFPVAFSGSAVAYVANEWVVIYSRTVSKYTMIKGLKITNAGTGLEGHAFRICSPAGNNIFSDWKVDTANTFTSDTEMTFTKTIDIRAGETFTIEVYCTATTDATAQVTSLKVIEVG